MKSVSAILVLLTILGVAICQTPTRPKFPEVFDAKVNIELAFNHTHRVNGNGVWASNQPKGQAAEHWHFDHSSVHNLLVLQRYDLGAVYTKEQGRPCHKHTVNGTMPAFWDWVAQAKFVGKRNVHGGNLDIWEATLGAYNVGVAVFESHVNVPVWFWRHSPSRNVTIEFEQFKAETPSAFTFTVPNDCKNATNASSTEPSLGTTCVARATMTSRAQVWVDNKVPYNQGGTYQGYREDCSGYVSMAWELPTPGRTTSTLGGVSHGITKAELQSGDVLLNAGEHVVLFGGWTSSAQTQYIAYEETRPGEGTVKRATPYPYWTNGAAFKPYRYNSVC